MFCPSYSETLKKYEKGQLTVFNTTVCNANFIKLINQVYSLCQAILYIHIV